MQLIHRWTRIGLASPSSHAQKRGRSFQGALMFSFVASCRRRTNAHTTTRFIAGHEGSHVADVQDVVSSISQTTTAPYFKVGADITRYQSEQRAYAVTDSILKSSNENWHFACGLTDCVLGTGMQMLAQRPGVIDQIMVTLPCTKAMESRCLPPIRGGSVVLTVPH
jgi:hypothetical protein